MKSLFVAYLLFFAFSIPVSAENPAQSKPKLPIKSCDEVVNDYQRSCLKSCETYKETRKIQCDAACNDSNQLRLRKTQCEEGRKA